MKQAKELFEELKEIHESISDHPTVFDIIEDFDFPDYLTEKDLAGYISDLECWASDMDEWMARIEEIREETQPLNLSNERTQEFDEIYNNIVHEYKDRSNNEIDEYKELWELWDDLHSSGETAIEEDSFHDYAIEMVKDCYPEFEKFLHSGDFPYNCMTLDEEELVSQVRQDYTEREINGKTYLYRA